MEQTLELKRIGSNPGLPARARQGHPVFPAAPGGAEALLEAGFAPVTSTLTSFLVNAFYLVGEHDVLEWTPRDGRAAAELARLGHRMAAAFPAGLRTAGPRPRHDRVMSLARAFGYLSDAENAAWLRAMNRLLRPGGLLCFHVIDRDRAWSRVGEKSEEGAEVSFDPASGRLSARLRPAGTGACAAAATVRTYNLGELKTLLAEAGFALERAYGDWEGGNVAEAGAATGRIIVVASKPRRARRVTHKLLRKEAPEGKGEGP
jgi:hypothetical protein